MLKTRKNGARAPAATLPLTQMDSFRIEAAARLDRERRPEWGQYLTPLPVARLMASMFGPLPETVRLLDAGAGTGGLTGAFVEEVCGRERRPRHISVTAYEIDRMLCGYLEESLSLCQRVCREADVSFSYRVFEDDFIAAHCGRLTDGPLFSGAEDRFNCAIMNPPYKKIRGAGRTRKQLRQMGIETSNLYAAFVAVTVRLLDEGGQLVAITPRSFCNGPYFRPFRRFLLENVSLRRLHVFEARDRAFACDNVLQENVIFHAERGGVEKGVWVSSSQDATSPTGSKRLVALSDVVVPGDTERVLHLRVSAKDEVVCRKMRRLGGGLDDLSLSVSTGRVVDFRAKEHLRERPSNTTASLLYPCHFHEGFIRWPATSGKKPNAIERNEATRALLVPSEVYVLVKRFSSKEERRRIVAAVCLPECVEGPLLGIENHLNYVYREGRGLDLLLAKGLAAYLNSTLVDDYFRQFSGHTQVNAADLRGLPYPSASCLTRLGERIGDGFPCQDVLDGLCEKELIGDDTEWHDTTRQGKNQDT